MFEFKDMPWYRPNVGEEVTLRFVDVPKRWQGSTGQRQCEHCGKFLRRVNPMPGISSELLENYTSGWKCVDVTYDWYYGAWEHQ